MRDTLNTNSPARIGSEWFFRRCGFAPFVNLLALFNLFGSNSPPLGAYTFAVVFGFDTPLLAAGLFICATLLPDYCAGIGRTRFLFPQYGNDG